MSTTRKLHPLEAAALGVDVHSTIVEKEKSTVESILPHLHDERECTNIVQKEKPWHRSLAYLLLQGVPQNECAKQFDCSPQMISILRRQEWFKALLVQLADLNFSGDMFGILEGAAFESITVLHDIALGGKSEQVRVSAATTLLDKFLKHQRPKETKPHDSPQAELDELDREIAALENEV